MRDLGRREGEREREGERSYLTERLRESIPTDSADLDTEETAGGRERQQRDVEGAEIVREEMGGREGEDAGREYEIEREGDRGHFTRACTLVPSMAGNIIKDIGSH
ncbi:hypothetical protein ACLOJK_040645 [Asimina triloba]